MPSDTERVRLDRWLWAARFYKTRARAKAAIEGGKVLIHPPGRPAPSAGSVHEANLLRPKVSKEIGVGDIITLRRSDFPETVTVMALADKRGSASVAATLYAETAASIELREAERSRRRLERLGLRAPPSRPDKHARRALRALKQDD